jgi:hypothetical protein
MLFGNDPTYVTEEIESNPIWHAAFIMSEILNDNAPLGWGKYIYAAERLQAHGLLITIPTKEQDDD